jgi:Tfp pilus assembly protein PilO
MLALLTVILIYAFLVIPSNSELEKNRAERDRLERELNTANSKYGNITSTESQVATLLNSVDNFETQYLPVASLGKNAVYQRINGLIATHGLVNTSGPDYSPLEFANQNSDRNKEEEKGRAKFRSIYPGMYVTMTVEGSYQNLRRFIADIERSGDFLTISSIELQPSDSDGQQQSAPEPQPARPVTTAPQISKNPSSPNMYPAPGMMSPVVTNFGEARGSKGKVHGDNISLRIELATYFRRPNFVPTNASSAQ